MLYLAIAAILTTVAMLYIANRMQSRPNRVQTAVETLFLLMRDNITRGNMDDAMARKWFPFIGTLFLFIWFSNLIGYIPLPTNTHATFDVFGIAVPQFALYAATANISVPARPHARRLGLATTSQGIRAQGVPQVLRELDPGRDAARDAPDPVRHRGDLALRPDHLASASDSSPTSWPATS